MNLWLRTLAREFFTASWRSGSQCKYSPLHRTSCWNCYSCEDDSSFYSTLSSNSRSSRDIWGPQRHHIAQVYHPLRISRKAGKWRSYSKANCSQSLSWWACWKKTENKGSKGWWMNMSWNETTVYLLVKHKAIYLRLHSAVPASRWCAPQQVSGTVGIRPQWHRVSTVDGFSGLFSSGCDIELCILGTGRP